MKFTDPTSLGIMKKYLKSQRYAYVLDLMLLLGFIYQQLTGSVSFEIPLEYYSAPLRPFRNIFSHRCSIQVKLRLYHPGVSDVVWHQQGILN